MGLYFVVTISRDLHACGQSCIDFAILATGKDKQFSVYPTVSQSVSRVIDPSAIQSFTHFDCCHSLALEWKEKKGAGADEADGAGDFRQPRCTIPWCASMKTNWYLPDTWDWLSSIKGAAAVVWLSDWMARMRCLHFEFTCQPRSRSRFHLDYLPTNRSPGWLPCPSVFRRWPELIFNYESGVLFRQGKRRQGVVGPKLVAFTLGPQVVLTNVSITWQPGYKWWSFLAPWILFALACWLVGWKNRRKAENLPIQIGLLKSHVVKQQLLSCHVISNLHERCLESVKGIIVRLFFMASKAIWPRKTVHAFVIKAAHIFSN